ncbi:MAG: putative transport system ATP-binding protein [Patescibacteria group bacterium]|jgi:putative ABC transport system ATP-binding protein|nr:putative transport system ATP-binding protein [Patescibacteria group bacterium]MDQ5912141.1 putative transport system ATP-binding protein [Patescibacteria group bacterium]MDQ5954290.1 putative transport system ATP-binding protein [Patescibacteria group bacterium]
MIKVNNLIKIFTIGDNTLTALKKISFSVPSGQFLAITGMSGSGKSTLLYQLSLLDNPNQGTILIENVDTSLLTSEERISFRLKNLGYIFQDYAILPMLTAKENVMMPLLMQGVDENIAQKKAEEALSKVDLQDRLDNLPSQLSGGQQQRVSIARSIVHNPKILFADEPTANLDTESSEKVLDIFLNLHKQGQTIIMVTHEPEYAKLAERNIELRDGSIINETIQ